MLYSEKEDEEKEKKEDEKKRKLSEKRQKYRCFTDVLQNP